MVQNKRPKQWSELGLGYFWRALRMKVLSNSAVARDPMPEAKRLRIVPSGGSRNFSKFHRTGPANLD